MEIILSDTKSSYNLDATEKQEFNHWLDRVVLASDPEDLTGTIFIDNFVQPEKAHRLTASGLVTAIVQRHPYRNTQTDVSDFVIENDDVHETNAKAGIYFDVSSPEIDQGFPIFEIMFRDEVFEYPRYSGVTYATLITPKR